MPSLLAIWFGLSGRIDVRRLGAIAVLFVASMIFWAIFEQAGVTIALFADQLTRADVMGLSFPSAWFQSLNSFFVILLTPFFAWYWMRGGALSALEPGEVRIRAGVPLGLVSTDGPCGDAYDRRACQSAVAKYMRLVAATTYC